MRPEGLRTHSSDCSASIRLPGARKSRRMPMSGKPPVATSPAIPHDGRPRRAQLPPPLRSTPALECGRPKQPLGPGKGRASPSAWRRLEAVTVGEALLRTGSGDGETCAVQRAGNRGELSDDVLAVPAVFEHPQHTIELPAGTLHAVDDRGHLGRVELQQIGPSVGSSVSRAARTVASRCLASAATVARASLWASPIIASGSTPPRPRCPRPRRGPRRCTAALRRWTGGRSAPGERGPGARRRGSPAGEVDMGIADRDRWSRRTADRTWWQGV